MSVNFNNRVYISVEEYFENKNQSVLGKRKREEYDEDPDLIEALLASVSSDLQEETKIASFADFGAGINNGGSTCYMSSVIQGLRFVPSFRTLLETKKRQQHPLSVQLSKLLNTIEGQDNQEKRNVTTEEINAYRRAMIHAGFACSSETSQEDALLFCQFLFETIGIAPFPFKTRVFHGLDFFISALDLQGGNDTLIALGIGDAKDNTTLQKLATESFIQEAVDRTAVQRGLQRQLKRKELQTLNRLTAAGALPTVQSIEFSPGHVPLFLPLAIRRFTNQGAKVTTSIVPSTCIDFPIEHEKSLRVRFQLRAVVVHSGEKLGEGHYYTYVVHQMQNQEAWLEFNDSNVFVHDSPKTAKRRAAEARSPTPYEDACRNGYLFLYELEKYV